MSAKSNHKQQQQARMVAAAMSTPCSIKPLLVAIPLALGFALGIVATLSLMGSSASSALPGAALELFFPSPPVNVSTQVRSRRPPRPVQVQPQAAPAVSASSPPPPPPVADAGVNKHAALPAQRRRAAPAAGVSSPPSPPLADAGSDDKRPVLPVNATTADEEQGEGTVVDDDERLLELAAAAPRAVRVGAGAAPKVAFLFLAKWGLPMAPLWERFFEGHRGLYSVYVHTDPAFNASAAAPDSGSAFHRRHIPSKEVKWGHISMVEAERRLLAHALLDHSNSRFILLSESHVPLFDFPTVYSYLTNSTKVYMESYDEPGGTGRGRYKRGMAPTITPWQWRKGSQWFEMDRALAIDIVADNVYFPVFKKFCKRNCYTDEHYIPTFLHIRHPEVAARRTVTWVDWSHGGPHPSRFTRMEVTVDFLRWLRGGTTCEYNGRTTTVCFLFARKFLPNSLTRFLRFAPKVMGFG
ncbi:glycosyltransferase BC10-like [Triticum dicoccoides]|uniref:glycosyltransferase BC10-like n=1 Tax=Triticum dicoccoides TaxID=85692 RepID=UPI00188E77D0|nr:glycosyltransferase BC10-like [Triticum dicoccoides]